MAEAEDSKIFPQKLMEILSDPENFEAICWLPHGKSFVVRNRKLFAEMVMPRYFSRKAKYSSFTRKLNRWNFSRVSSGPEIGAYHHELFCKDKPYLAATMFCKNARTMLAMASSPRSGESATLKDRPAPESIGSEQANSLSDSHREAEDNFRKELLQINSMTASPSLLGGGAHQGLMAGLQLGNAFPPANIQLLERQIRILQQQEENNRMLLEHAMLLQRQREFALDEEQRKLTNDGFRLGLQSSSRMAPRKPSGNRASAA